MDHIIRRRLFGHVARLGSDTPAHQALRRQIDVSLAWRIPIVGLLGSVLLVAQEASGWIRFALITTSYRLIYGDVPSVEVTPS